MPAVVSREICEDYGYGTSAEERTDMKVPGRKIVVKTAMVFMDALSLLFSDAILLESFAISVFRTLSSWAMRLCILRVSVIEHFW